VSASDERKRGILGQAIREAREQQDQSVSELAVATGIRQQTIAGIEAGQKESHLELLLLLADGLGVRPSSFFVRVEELEGDS
jgi:transcriptional regulator with XRE-family HTH domain